MDGNGRWAKEQGVSRVKGHQAGAESAEEIVRECGRLGIKRLTLYAFSRENWKRPRYEINYLMKLLRQYLIRERPKLMKNNIKFAVIGRIEELPAKVQDEITRSIKATEHNTGLTLCLALNYGARTEIADALRKICQNGIDVSAINEETLRKYLYDPEMPDPDLLIRTGGEMRVSNFLLWQISYTEFWVTPKFWPDFSKEDLYEAITEYSRRERRFGGRTQ